MKKWIAVFALIFLVAIGVAMLWPVPVRIVTISFAAPPGTKVTGSYQVDGVNSPISLEAPAEISMSGRIVQCSVHKDAQPGQMIVRISVQDHGYASTGTGPSGSAHMGFESGPWFFSGSTFWATNAEASPNPRR